MTGSRKRAVAHMEAVRLGVEHFRIDHLEMVVGAQNQPVSGKTVGVNYTALEPAIDYLAGRADLDHGAHRSQRADGGAIVHLNVAGNFYRCTDTVHATGEKGKASVRRGCVQSGLQGGRIVGPVTLGSEIHDVRRTGTAALSLRGTQAPQ